MKVHYINILLFALPLNILKNNQRNHNSTTYHTSNTKRAKIHRTLCECKLYAPSNYDNDPGMKKVMEIYNRETSQRLREYDERMQDKLKQCKEQCNKYIQKIILKDKIEKELTEKLSTLQTDICADDILTCICEKSVADKVEKTCLKCGKTLTGVVPGLGLIGGTAVYAAAVNAATKAGISKAIQGLEYILGLKKIIGSDGIQNIVTPLTYNKPQSLFESIYAVEEKMCVGKALQKQPFCAFAPGGTKTPFWYANAARQAAADSAEVYVAEFVTETSPTSFLTNPYIASSIAIMVLVAILLVIYLILRYRRKRKMTRKLQYIKLLKE
ncbi:rifin [Plasmodium sp. gorilla clade G1]|nr:rifin [Plasmodium sp. gorilla clade G1]